MLMGVAMLMRFGLLALTTGSVTVNLLQRATLTLELSAWYAGGTLLVLSIAAVIAGYGFSISLGGRSLFKDDVLEA